MYIYTILYWLGFHFILATPNLIASYLEQHVTVRNDILNVALIAQCLIL
jgi:hypothetical protein